MNDRRYLELLSLVMCCLRFNMQILEFVRGDSDVTAWKKGFDNIEKEFEQIVERTQEGM